MANKDLGGCSGMVSDSKGWGSHKCSFKAIVVRDGKGYCKKHDPEYIQTKREEEREKWNREMEERVQKRKRLELEKEYCKDISTEELEKQIKQRRLK